VRFPGLGLCLVVLALTCGLCWSQPHGLSNRVANTTLRLPASPPVVGYTTVNAFPGLSFLNPLAIATPPGETNRLFVVEQAGLVIVITNLAAPTRTVFLDLRSKVVTDVPPDERGLLGIAFHPGYATNRYFFVYYSTVLHFFWHQRLSRFEASPTDPNSALVESEVPLLSLWDDVPDHNGGDLHFGPDGYLYVSTGDEGGANDALDNSQFIDKDFWAGILRLDVDQRPGNLVPNPHSAIDVGNTNYSVPADNPFVGVTQWHGQNLDPLKVRTEFYAVGLRNPWRMSFDPATGRLLCGDVGQDAVEEIDLIVKGGNYGWPFREGNILGPKPAPPGATAIEPIWAYRHTFETNSGVSVTGGTVYRGRRIPELFGRYVFGDYVSGNIWSFYYDGAQATEFRFLTSDTGIAAFGTDPRNGDILLADQSDDAIKRLVQTTDTGTPLPPTLAEAGAFADLATLTPYEGIEAYDVNLPFWSDGAKKQRWFYVPPESTIGFHPTNSWTFPSGSVWIKHFDLELIKGVPESKRRLETRFLVRDDKNGVYGITYRWDDTQTTATLVPEGGQDEVFQIYEGGVVRQQVWRYPSRAECLVCHNAQAGLVLSFNTPQLNRDFDFVNGVTDNQIRALNHAGYFTSLPGVGFYSLRALAQITNETISVEQRVRSYLAVNCAPCHQPNGSALGFFDARLFGSLTSTKLVDGLLVNHGGNPDNRVVTPGSLERSMLLQRISKRGLGQMPPLASTVVDAQAVNLISCWITNGLVGTPSFTEWQMENFQSTNAVTAQPDADPDGDRAINWLEYLTGTDPNLATDAWRVAINRSGDGVEIVFPRRPNCGFEVQWTPNSANPTSWRFLDVPQNQPRFMAIGGEAHVFDVITSGPTRFYRVRVYEP